MNEREHAAYRTGKRWIAEYNRHLFLCLALKRLAAADGPMGTIRAEVTASAWSLIDLDDQLEALGFTAAFALGGEVRFWRAVKRYALSLPWQTVPSDITVEELGRDLSEAQTAWEGYVAAVTETDENILLVSRVLDTSLVQTGGLMRLFRPVGKSIDPSHNLVPEHFRESADQHLVAGDVRGERRFQAEAFEPV